MKVKNIFLILLLIVGGTSKFCYSISIENDKDNKKDLTALLKYGKSKFFYYYKVEVGETKEDIPFKRKFKKKKKYITRHLVEIKVYPSPLLDQDGYEIKGKGDNELEDGKRVKANRIYYDDEKMSIAEEEIKKNGKNAKYTLTSNGEGFAVEGEAMEEIE